MDKVYKYGFQVHNVSKEQWDEIRPLLVELGRAYDNKTTYYDPNWNLLKVYPSVGFNILYNYQTSRNYITLHSYNKDLILALAAMVDSNEFHPGEWLTHRTANWEGEIYEYSHSTNDKDILCFMHNGTVCTSGYLKDTLRKATSDEIIAYFTKRKAAAKVHTDVDVAETPVATDEFVLPGNWAVVRTPENHKIVNEWFSEALAPTSFSADSKYFDKSLKDYLHYPRFNNKSVFSSLQKGYTEITFELFQEHILKQKTNKVEKKIVGYKSPMNLFNNHTIKGDIYIPAKSQVGYYICQKFKPSQFQYLLPKEIVETWEPVYEALEKRVTFGHPQKTAIVYSDGKVTIEGHTDVYRIGEVQSLINKIADTKVSTYIGSRSVEGSIESVHIGCKSEGTTVTLEELKSITKAYRDFI